VISVYDLTWLEIIYMLLPLSTVKKFRDFLGAFLGLHKAESNQAYIAFNQKRGLDKEEICNRYTNDTVLGW
jgi:hypothetical protein